MALVEDDAVTHAQLAAGREAVRPPSTLAPALQLDQHAARRGPNHPPNADAAALGEAGVDQPLVVNAVNEAVREPAGKALGQLQLLLARNLEGLMARGRIDRGAVGLCGRGDVVRTLEPALDLEAGHAEVGQLAD